MRHREKLIKTGYIAGVTGSVYILIKYILPLVAPFLVAWFLYCLLRPQAIWLKEKTGVSTRITGVFCLILWMLAFGSVTIIIIKWFWVHAYEIIDLGKESFDIVCGCIDFMLKKPHGFLENIISQHIVFPVLDQNQIFNLLQHFLENLARAGVIIFIGILGTIILIRDRYMLYNELREHPLYKEMSQLFMKMTSVFAAFIKTQGIIMLIILLLDTLILLAGGFKTEWWMGIVIAVLDALPIIGSGMILLPWILISWVQKKYIEVIILLMMYGCNILVREWMEPRLMGKKLEIASFYMLMATVIGIQLFGIWGLFTGPVALVLIKEILCLFDV